MRQDENGEQLRLLHVHAHPDDESSKGAATTARYVAEGVEVMVATCTGGERGDVLNPVMNRPEIVDNIAAVRAKEMDAARKILGIKQVWLGFVDSGFPEGDPLPPLPEGCFALVDIDEAVAELVSVIRKFKPQVMTTYDEFGGYPHPDHIRCHEISVAAYEAAADPKRYPDAGPAWQVSKLYYQLGWTKGRLEALDQACRDAGIKPPYSDWLDNWNDREAMDDRVTTRIDCANYFEVRDAALRAHATQVDPEGMWFAVPMEIQQRVWPTEDYQLVASAVATEMPETDLFSGVAVS